MYDYAFDKAARFLEQTGENGIRMEHLSCSSPFAPIHRFFHVQIEPEFIEVP